MKLRTILGCMSIAHIYCAIGDEFHYNNLLIGGEALGIGGAFVSIANDMSATHYNPAGLSYASSHSSASINTFAWEQTEFSNVFSNGDDFTRNSFSIVPGFFGASTDFGNWTIGGSLAVTDYSNERTSLDAMFNLQLPEGADSSISTEFISIDLENSAYRLALSSAYKVSDNLSFGASFQIEYRDFKTVQASGVRNEIIAAETIINNGFSATRRYTDTNIILRPTLGVIWKKSSYAFGMRIGNDYGISRDYEGTSTVYIASNVALPNSVQIASRVTESSEEKQKYPFHIAIGNSYQFEKLLISFDITYHSQVGKNSEVSAKTLQPTIRSLKQVTNYSLGFAYQVADDSYIKLGLFTDKSNGEIDTSIDYQRIEDIDLYGISLAYDTEILERPISLGIYHKFGTGKIRTADIRGAENIVGLPIYPPSDNFDIIDGKKQSLVAYLSVNF